MKDLKLFFVLSIISLLSQQVMAFMMPACSMNNQSVSYSEAQVFSDKDVTPCHASDGISIIDSSQNHTTCDSTCGNCCVVTVGFVLSDTLNIPPIFMADAYNYPPTFYLFFLSPLHAKPPIFS